MSDQTRIDTIHHQPGLKTWLLFIVLVVVWGSSFAATKAAVESLSPEWVVAFRLSIGACVFVPIAVAKNAFPTRKWSHTYRYIILAVMANILPFTLISWGTQHISSALAGILMAMVPLNVMIGAHLFLDDETMTRRTFIGVAMGILGVCFVMRVDQIAFSSMTSSFAILAQVGILIATVCYAGSSVYTRLFKDTSPLEKTVGILGYAGVIAIAIALFRDPSGWQAGSLEGYASVIFLGIFPTGLAALILFHLLEVSGTRFVAYSNFLIPVFASVLGFVILGEPFHISAAIGLMIIIAGIAISQYRPKSGS